jgi:hypothetical protein
LVITARMTRRTSQRETCHHTMRAATPRNVHRPTSSHLRCRITRGIRHTMANSSFAALCKLELSTISTGRRTMWITPPLGGRHPPDLRPDRAAYRPAGLGPDLRSYYCVRFATARITYPPAGLRACQLGRAPPRSTGKALRSQESPGAVLPLRHCSRSNDGPRVRPSRSQIGQESSTATGLESGIQRR